VINERKPGKKLPVVFDCAAVHKGLFLNQVLMQGPDLVNDFAGVNYTQRYHTAVRNC